LTNKRVSLIGEGGKSPFKGGTNIKNLSFKDSKKKLIMKGWLINMGIFDELFGGSSKGNKGLIDVVFETVEKSIKKDGPIDTTIPNSVFKTSSIANEIHDLLKSKNTKYAKEPAYGSVVYCQLGPVEHSGIYVGNHKIVQLNGQGRIEKVSLSGFTDHITTIDSAIYFPCDNEYGHALGLGLAGSMAIDMIGKRRNYNLILDNCHQFSSGCLTGDFENADNFLWTLKDTFERKFDCSVYWKRWDW
jgi:hypothetical protein